MVMLTLSVLRVTIGKKNPCREAGTFNAWRSPLKQVQGGLFKSGMTTHCGEAFKANYFTLIAPRSNLIVKLVTSHTSLGPQYWIGPG